MLSCGCKGAHHGASCQQQPVVWREYGCRQALFTSRWPALCCYVCLQELNGSTPAQMPGVGLTGMQALKPFVAGLIVSDGELHHWLLVDGRSSSMRSGSNSPQAHVQLPLLPVVGRTTAVLPCSSRPAPVRCTSRHAKPADAKTTHMLIHTPMCVFAVAMIHCARSAAASRRGLGTQIRRQRCQQRPADAAVAAAQRTTA